MKRHSINQHITVASAITLAKAAAIGLLAGELWYFAQSISPSLYKQLDTGDNQFLILILCGVLLLALSTYAYFRDLYFDLQRLIRSRRADVLASFLAGLYISASFEGIGSHTYAELGKLLSPSQIIPIFLLPILFGILQVIRGVIISRTALANDSPPFFISDLEKHSKRDDLLDFSEAATRFADRVFNGGSPDSVVFGIDAPWGIGKSTFVNFCAEHWEGEYKDQVIIYKFNLLRYGDRASIQEKFVDGLIRTIQKASFIPEIRPLVSRYSRFIKNKTGIAQFGIGVELLPGTYTVDDAFDDLEFALSHLTKKIIVIIDDLDRIGFEAIKDVLFAIKKSFTLPNLSYVLCYDTDNILAQTGKGSDADKVIEFLEKFVNVKISLFLHADTLAKYISDNFDKAVRDNRQIDPYTLENIKTAVSIVKDIYKSPDFHHYQPILGDIRKLKRLINTLLLFEIEKTDFENSDIDKHDLIHLLLIYINYPNICRKIYNTETGDKKGFFSLVGPSEDGYPLEAGEERPSRSSQSDYRNSKSYKEYVAKLSHSQRFLLNKVFLASERLEDTIIEHVPAEVVNIYACFNGTPYARGSRNLEHYLNLIVSLSKPQRREQYQFYLNVKNKLVTGTPIEDVLSENEFAYAKGEDSRQQFWRVVVNSADDFNADSAQRLITHLLDHISDYSLFSNDKISLGFRDDIPYLLIKLLDSAGWSDATGRRRDNTDVAGIAAWIFGEGSHTQNGVVQKLGSDDRGLPGLFDLLVFRLFCSADRSGHFFNLQRALVKHGDPSGPTSGDLRTIAIAEMRELSQVVFKVFEDRFITPQKNIFDSLAALSLGDVIGKYGPYLDEKTNSGDISEEETKHTFDTLKTRMMAFITYQLGNPLVSSGVGCGYYDPTGNSDQKGIAIRINDYLFDICFNPAGGQKNFEYFVDYLLINFAHTFDSDPDRRYVPHAEEFTKVLDRQRLIQYWQANAHTIKALGLPNLQKTVRTGNYTATYRDDLNDVFSVLDQMAAGNPAESGQAAVHGDG